MSRVIAVGIDRVAGAIVTVDGMHHEVHKGDAFYAGLSIDVPAGTTIWLVAEVDGQPIHMQDRSIKLINTATSPNNDVTIELRRDIVASIVGTSIPIKNKNHNLEGIILPTLVIRSGYTDAQITDEGELYPSPTRIIGASKEVKVVTAFDEYVMALNSTYGLKIINAGQAITLSFEWNWYEPRPIRPEEEE